MANLSNINGKFVVEQTTGYVGVGTTDPSYPIEVLNASAAEIALNASGGSIYRLRSDNTDSFRINKNGVGDRLVIDGSGNSTFSGTITNVGSITTKASGASNSIVAQWQATNANNCATFRTTDSGYIFRIHAQNAGTIYVQNDDGSNYLKIPDSGSNEISGNTTFAGNVTLNQYLEISSTTAQYAYMNFGASAGYGWQLGKAPATGGVVDDQGFYLYNLNTGYQGVNLAVLKSGNIGIGTDSPNAKLEVASGQAKTVTSGVEFARFGTSNEASNYATLTCEVKGAAAAADRKWIFQTIESGVANAGNIVFQPSGGNIGIGTDSPGSAYKLDVDGIVYFRTELYLINPTARMYLGSGTGYCVINKGPGITGTATRLYFGEDSDSGLTMFRGTGNVTVSSANVGIGTSSPTYPLEVVKNTTNNFTHKIGNDSHSEYGVSGLQDHTVTLECPSYYNGKVIITASQTNGGGSNNIYLEGIWQNNHTTHNFTILHNTGSLSGSSITTTVSAGPSSASGRLVVFLDYGSGSFANMVVRVCNYYGAHTGVIT